ncbi:hypothetical protein [Marinobacter confluentis]|uniref:Uncharacterized protein n=1 Tax=Marinobacter confluentis TaxID=1697557 RepID=A0A4Z1BTI5_9GAMM|nr:hypothetical protein [Marinobacter confluentis]TGN40519.1 hypothetical protein E5Q11_09660 [Marinobacter confluentis]
MIRQHTRRLWLLLYAVAAALVLTGCGGGGGGGSSSSSTPQETSSVSGTAAAGAPLVGFVGARDNAGETATANINADGSFELPLDGLSPPVLIYASGIAGGNAYQLLSVVFDDEVNGTVNITPITDLIVGNAVGGDPLTFFNNPDFTQLTQTRVEEAETALKARLKPLFDGVGVDEDFDLRNTPFNADRSGFDAALDVIDIQIDSATNTATITNRINPTQTIQNNFTQPEVETDPIVVDETELSDGVTTLQALDTLATAFAAALDAQDGTALEALVTADYLNNGEDISGLQDRLFGSDPGIEDAGELADEIRNWSLADLDTEAGTAQLNIGAAQGPWNVVRDTDSGDWQIQGNQLQFFAFVEPTHVVQSGAETPEVTAIGTLIYAGFPADTLTASPSFVSVTSGDLPILEGNLTLNSSLGRYEEFAVLEPNAIASGDQVTFNWNGEAQATYTIRRGTPDLSNGAPEITSQSADLDADTYTFEWTLPPGYDSVSVRNNFTGQTTGGEGNGFTGNPLNNEATSFTGELPAAFVPSEGDELRIIARDPFGVFVSTRLANPFADQVPPPMAEDALIGSWIARNPDRTDNAPWVQLTFLENGYYMHQELDLPFRPEEDTAGMTGLEFGQYQWDNQTGEVTNVSIVRDDNGEWGLSDLAGTNPDPLALVVDGDTLTAYNPDVGLTESTVFTRVPTNQSGIAGSWIIQDPADPTNTSVLTILEDNFYFLGTTQPADATGQPGLEFGTFTYDSATLVLNPTAVVDQNGEYGLSDPIQGFDYATVIDGFLIIDDGESFQLSEIAPGVTPSDGTVTVNYVSPDDETTPGPAVTGDFHYLRSSVGIESSRLSNPPSVFQVHFAHEGANIVDNTDGTGTLSWTDLCIGDLLIDSGASEDGRDAVFDSVSECLGISGNFDLSFTDTGLFAAVPGNTLIDPEDGSQIINGATEIDFRALDAERSLFIANEANTFQYEESNGSFTDGRDMNTHVLSKKDPALTADALAGDWGFVTLRINQTTDPIDDTVLVANFMDYGAGALNITVDATGNATLTDELQLLLLQGLKPLQDEGVSIDPIMEENGLSDSLGAFSIAADGTLSLLNGEVGGFASQGADVMTLALPNPFTPYTVQTKESSLLTGVKLDPNFQAADLAGKSYDVILKGYFAGQNYFETDIWLPGATLAFDASGGATSQRGLTFAFTNFGLDTDVFDTTRQSANLDPNTWTYQVDTTTGLIRMESPNYTYSGGGTGFGEQVGYSSADNRLLVLVSRFYDNSGGTPMGPGGTYIAYAICNNCN